MTLLALALATTVQVAAADTARFTRLEIVLDRATWSEVKASTHLPLAYGSGYLAGPAEVRLCDRLGCLVMVPADSAAGVVVGDVTIGVTPVAGSALAARLAEAPVDRIRLRIVEPPPGPDLSLSSDSLPTVYFLGSVRLFVPATSISRLDGWFRSAGADVVREGEGLVVQFGSQVIRLHPAYGDVGPELLTLTLRRDVPGNPTYRFGDRSRLRFGPGRIAQWSF